MSGSGQKRRFDPLPVTSGLPLKADNFRAGRHVSKVPAADVRDYSITLQHGEDGLRHAECLGSCLRGRGTRARTKVIETLNS